MSLDCIEEGSSGEDSGSPSDHVARFEEESEEEEQQQLAGVDIESTCDAPEDRRTRYLIEPVRRRRLPLLNANSDTTATTFSDTCSEVHAWTTPFPRSRSERKLQSCAASEISSIAIVRRSSRNLLASRKSAPRKSRRYKRLDHRIRKVSNDVDRLVNALYTMMGFAMAYTTLARFPEVPVVVVQAPSTHPGTCSLILIAVLFNVWWLHSNYQTWKTEFRDTKTDRHNPKTPSNMGRPKLKSQKCKLSLMKQLNVTRRALTEHYEETSELRCRGKARQTEAYLHSDSDACPYPQPKRASSLNMNHVALTWWQWLWITYFVLPNAVYLWVTGILKLMIRSKLVKLGLLRPTPVDYRKLAGKMLLESFEVLQLHGIVEKDGTQVGIYNWPDFPILQLDNTKGLIKLVQIEVDLKTKEMRTGKVYETEECLTSGEFTELSPKDAVVLIWFHTISAGHVRIHAFANWGINVSEQVDPFTQRMGVVTTAYNHFGYSSFKRLAELWRLLGWARFSLSGINEVFDHGIDGGVMYHGNLRQLSPHSDIVTFILRLRNAFLNTFKVWRDEKKAFPGIDGEAMFIGTVIHSLDHTLMSWNMEDPLWLEAEDGRYAAIAELGRFVRVGFVDDLPGLLFNKRYKDSPHPFYREVYNKAAKINKRLADMMDACIVK